jgi:hypothetical protein
MSLGYIGGEAPTDEKSVGPWVVRMGKKDVWDATAPPVAPRGGWLAGVYRTGGVIFRA